MLDFQEKRKRPILTLCAECAMYGIIETESLHLEFEAHHFERCSFAQTKETPVSLHDTDWASGNHKGS